MTIRRMIPADAPSIHAIHCACLDRTLLGRYSQEQVSAWLKGRTPEGYLRAADSGERFFVVEIDGAVVAYASWCDDELLSLFVHPDFQRRGIGARLVAACDDEANAEGLSVSKVKSVLGAEAFYARHGFAAVGPGSTTKHGVVIPDMRMQRP